MKTTAILFLAYLALCVQCSVPENKSTKKEISTQPIKVGVFDGHGGAQTCIWETVAAIRLDPEMEVCTITTADIANNVLDSIDAIIIPGGSGKSQYLNLGTLNQQRIKDFISKGKGAVGICAGAYLFSNTPDYIRYKDKWYMAYSCSTFGKNIHLYTAKWTASDRHRA